MNEASNAMNMIERLAQRIALNDDPLSPAAPVQFRVDGDKRTVGDVPSLTISRLAIQFGDPPLKPTPQVSAPLLELDLKTLRNKNYLTPGSPHSLLAEEYRVIKRSILRDAFGPGHPVGGGPGSESAHVVMITSPRPGEGKTFTAINLALSVATEHDCHVLLIDGDVRQRGMSHTLGAADRGGLMDVLSDTGVTLADVILRTNIPRLTVLPAGRLVTAPGEHLASRRMQELMAEIGRRYSDRFIIFDAPPVLASSEPGVLAAYVGQVIMLVTAGETPKQALAESCMLLDVCPNINFILNKVTLSAGSDRFGYYGDYSEDPDVAR